MSTEFKVGMRVRLRYDNNYFGTVTEVDEDEILVKWDRTSEEDPERIDADDLAAYDPEGDKVKALKIQPKIDAAAVALEQAFSLWQEAQELYDESFDGDPYEIMHNDLIDMSKFKAAFESTGWSTSGGRNLYC